MDGADKRRMGGYLALVRPLVPPLYVTYAQSPVFRLLETQRESVDKYQDKGGVRESNGRNGKKSCAGVGQVQVVEWSRSGRSSIV